MGYFLLIKYIPVGSSTFEKIFIIMFFGILAICFVLGGMSYIEDEIKKLKESD